MSSNLKPFTKIACAAFLVSVALAGGLYWRAKRRGGQALEVGQCTWYAFERAKEGGWQIHFDHPYGRHARAWPQRVTNGRLVSEPARGEVMVLDAWPGNAYGHVAYVESIQDADHWTVSHANMVAGASLRTLDGVTIRAVKVIRHGSAIAFEGLPGELPLIGFLAKSG